MKCLHIIPGKSSFSWSIINCSNRLGGSLGVKVTLSIKNRRKARKLTQLKLMIWLLIINH